MTRLIDELRKEWAAGRAEVPEKRKEEILGRIRAAVANREDRAYVSTLNAMEAEWLRGEGLDAEVDPFGGGTVSGWAVKASDLGHPCVGDEVLVRVVITAFYDDGTVAVDILDSREIGGSTAILPREKLRR